ncbi:DUF3889 domain-containing protein [Metabacillus arenae]|uniref:DUF3889 domain-containing protein n=1 Tax=Metabacillus arenae TaxID=2771434 RepID=A0A926RYE0_9BACI|nr:DUF3889 domain-containing protein [Metabacillus arenae]MBD1381092.1 DUF3889 domain-containing protein [Metabacillus arenae]
MKRFVNGLLISIMALTTFFQMTLQVNAEITAPVPEYAKWGKLAVNKTKDKYPNAQVIDYLHIGKEENNRISKEKFKLIVRQNSKEFGVFVTIEFNEDTEEVRNISFQETTP